MGSLYEDLGAPPTADQEALRRVYRQRARELHPDVNADARDESAMQRLNAAWAVLGDPVSRRRYDEQLRSRAHPPISTGPAESASSEPESSAAAAPAAGFRLVRPSVIMLGVLFVIFVITAYAGHPGSSGTAPSGVSSISGQPATSRAPTPTLTVPASAFVGHCIQDQAGGSVSLVPCTVRPSSLVIATVPSLGTCPAGTFPYAVADQSEMLCARPTSP